MVATKVTVMMRFFMMPAVATFTVMFIMMKTAMMATKRAIKYTHTVTQLVFEKYVNKLYFDFIN